MKISGHDCFVFIHNTRGKDLAIKAGSPDYIFVEYFLYVQQNFTLKFDSPAKILVAMGYCSFLSLTTQTSKKCVSNNADM